MPHRNVLSTHSLDRLAHRRTDDSWLGEALASGDTVAIVTWQGKVAVMGDSPAVVPAPHGLSLAGREPILLGTVGDVVHIAVDLSHLPQSEVEAALPADAMLAGLRDVTPMLGADAGNLLAMASALTTWHANHRHCGRCGAPTTVRAAGTSATATPAATPTSRGPTRP